MAVAKRHVEAEPAFAQAFGQAERRLNATPYLSEMRRKALQRFLGQGVPTTRVEEWKYTNAVKAVNRPMALAPVTQIGVDDLTPYMAGGTKARRLIFANGHLMPGLSHYGGLPEGLIVRPLSAMLREEPQRVLEGLGRLDDARGFTDLNTAFVEDGVWIEVADGLKVKDPLQLVFLTKAQDPKAQESSGADALMTHPRLFATVGEGAGLHLIETHVGVRAGEVMTNTVSQFAVAAGGELTHDRLQLAKDGAVTLSKADVEVAEGSRYKQTVVTLGGAMQRNETEARIKGPNAEVLLNGAFMPTDAEHVDNMIRLHHMAPDCHSDQFYKGVLNGKSRGVFAGKIFVHPDAQRTNAFQQNNNMLLSDDAEIDTKPELEIYADDVKCSHGATVGDLDATSLFYLRSRGLDRATAESILTYAFVGEVLERYADEATRGAARRAVFKRLPGGEVLEGML